MKNFDLKKIENAVSEMLLALGENVNREGLVDTPKRVANMFDELFEGMKYSNEEIAKMNDKCFTEGVSDDLVVIKDIECFSHCEHHMALIYDLKISVAYIPHGKVIGISKVARIADLVCKRLQLQERIGRDIVNILKLILGTENIAVMIEGKHSCMTARGIKKSGSETTTSTLSGAFKNSAKLRGEVLSILK